MIKLKHTFALLVILCVIVNVFAGCNTETTDDPEKSAAPAEKVKISFCMSQTGWGGQAAEAGLMAAVEKQIEDKTGVDLEIISPPHSSYNDKLNVMLTSKQIPDIFAVRKATDNLQIIARRGNTLALDEYIKDYPEIDKLVTDDLRPYVTVQDKLHGVPMYKPLAKILWLRKDAAEKYGVNLSETPTTEEFYTEMKKINSSEIIPFTFPKFIDNLPYFTNPFGAYFGIGINSDGKYYDGFNTEEMKEALQYVAKLYKDKIWDQEFLTNENTKIRESLTAGKAAASIDYINRFIYYSAESEKVNAFTEFKPIYTLKGPNGGSGNLNEAVQDVLCIGSSSENPKKALEVLQYFFYTPEGVTLRTLGVKGEHYTVENGLFTPTEKATNSGYSGDANMFFILLPEVKDFGFKWDDVTEKYLGQQGDYSVKVNEYLGPKFLTPGGKSKLYDKQLPAYKKKIEEISSKIIMGSSSVEDAFKEYTAWWTSIKGDAMLEELNQ